MAENKNNSVLNMFYENVMENPEGTAIICGNRSFTYKEFNNLSNQFAHYILKEDKEKNVVAVLLERSAEMMIAIYGILKSGHAYLPLSTEDPPKRIQFILQDSGVQLLITSKKFRNAFSFKGKILYIDEMEWENEKTDNLPVIQDQNDLAYIIYTSGTTGEPKGVMIEHQALYNRLRWMMQKYPLTPFDRVLQKTPYTFDVSVWEIFLWAMVGCSVLVMEPGGHKNVLSIIEQIAKNRISVIHFVPSMFNVFLEYIKENRNHTLEDISSLKYIFCSGEVLHGYQVAMFQEIIFPVSQTRLINLYGPTEATIDVTFFECTNLEETNVIPIGKPIDNIHIYILDEHDRICRLGEKGEICITGIGLARGYLNRKELNAEKFGYLPNNHTIRMYRTGDLGEWLPDGNIKYLGRIDHQVKINGNRVEVSEVESQLYNSRGVKDTVVMAADGKNGSQYLCAFVVPDESFSSTGDIIKTLKQNLPGYMVPTHIKLLEEIPTSGNGKADVNKLKSFLNNSIDKVENAEDADLVILRNILNEVVDLKVPVNEITYSHSLDDLGVESLSFLRMLIKIEKSFQIEFNIDDLDGVSLHTIELILNYIHKRKGNSNLPSDL